MSAAPDLCDPNLTRWRIDDVRVERSCLSERALMHRSKAGLGLVFVSATWYVARELAAIFFGLNIDDVTVVRDDRAPFKVIDDAILYVVHVGHVLPSVNVYPLVAVWREGVDLCVAPSGFFDAENEPTDDEYAPVPAPVDATVCDWTDCDALSIHVVYDDTTSQSRDVCERHYALGLNTRRWA